MQPIEYATASWRRALLSLEEHHKAWLLWSYGENINWDHQVTITRWGWEQFSQHLEGKRVARKTVDRLRQLIWLAAQDTKGVLVKGLVSVEHQELAKFTGVSKSTWSETYAPHWEAMQRIYEQFDGYSLLAVSKTRSQQKTANYQQDIAKPN